MGNLASHLVAMRVRNARVVVTGASSGIGRETAALLARKGARVVAVARSETPLKELAREYPNIEPVVADLANETARRELVAGVGAIDVLINNAGIGWIGLVEQMAFEDVRRLYEINVLGLIDLTLQFLPGMLEAKRGRIINVSSAAAWVAHPPLSVYGSTKWAVQGFSEGLRRELNGRRVAVTTINPGPVSTRFGARGHHGDRPSEELPDERWAGVPASLVARAVARAVRLGAWPGYTTISVPRLMGLSRLGGLPVTQWTVDLVALPFRELRRHRASQSAK